MKSLQRIEYGVLAETMDTPVVYVTNHYFPNTGVVSFLAWDRHTALYEHSSTVAVFRVRMKPSVNSKNVA